jgi:Protein of unknown function (DUF998)
VKGAALHRARVLAGVLAGPFFLISVGLNTGASIAYLHRLGWEFVGGEQVPWPSSLARGPYGWAQVATFLITGLLIVILAVAVRDQLPHRRASSVAVVLLAMLGVALILAPFRVDVPMLNGESPATWHGWVHGIAFLLIIATGVLAPLTMAFAVRVDARWRPIAVVSLAASALFIVFLTLPWVNATFLLAIVPLFGWIAALAARLATHHPVKTCARQDRQPDAWSRVERAIGSHSRNQDHRRCWLERTFRPPAKLTRH